MNRLSVHDVWQLSEKLPELPEEIARKIGCEVGEIKTRLSSGGYYWEYGSVDSIVFFDPQNIRLDEYGNPILMPAPRKERGPGSNELPSVTFKVQGLPIAGVCDALPPKTVAAIADSLIDGTIEGVVFLDKSSEPRAVNLFDMPTSVISAPWVWLQSERVIFSLRSGVDAEMECDRVNALLGADIAFAGPGEWEIECSLTELWKIENG